MEYTYEVVNAYYKLLDAIVNPAIYEKKEEKETNNYYFELCKISSAISGIPTEWIYAQIVHESENFTNWGATVAHNYAGIKQFKEQPDWFIATGESAESTEGDDYQVFNTDEEFFSYFGRYLRMYEPDGLLDAKTIEEYATALFNGGYYGLMPGMTAEESVQNYINGLQRTIDQLREEGCFGE